MALRRTVIFCLLVTVGWLRSRVVPIPNRMKFHCHQIVVRANEPAEMEPNKAIQEAQSKDVHVDEAKDPWCWDSSQNIPLGPAASSSGGFNHP